MKLMKQQLHVAVVRIRGYDLCKQPTIPYSINPVFLLISFQYFPFKLMMKIEIYENAWVCFVLGWFFCLIVGVFFFFFFGLVFGFDF